MHSNSFEIQKFNLNLNQILLIYLKRQILLQGAQNREHLKGEVRA